MRINTAVRVTRAGVQLLPEREFLNLRAVIGGAVAAVISFGAWTATIARTIPGLKIGAAVIEPMKTSARAPSAAKIAPTLLVAAGKNQTTQPTKTKGERK